MNKKGQSVLAEYGMIFFVVVAALIAMTTFVQRSLKARIHDARNFAVESVNAVCDANCLSATGGNIAYGYEPYYTQSLTDVIKNQDEKYFVTPGNKLADGSIYNKTMNQDTEAISTSKQLPPCASQNPPPAWCGNYGS